jgi:hypothetical protein
MQCKITAVAVVEDLGDRSAKLLMPRGAVACSLPGR